MVTRTDIDRPAQAIAVAQRYLRHERPLSALVVVAITAIYLATYLATSLLPAIAVGVALFVAVRAPVLRTHGTMRLQSAADPETVRAAFAGPIPPVLAFRWGIADDIGRETDITTYTVSYLFGLQSVDHTLRTHTETTADADRVILKLTANSQQRGTYAVTIRGDGDRTLVDIEYTSDRRVGLRRLPQTLVARRYRDEALAVQGYTVLERNSSLL